MSEFLTKEEIVIWRRSTEKLTLEEFARKLGKKLQDQKDTYDICNVIGNKPEEPRLKVYKATELERPQIVKPAAVITAKEETPAKPVIKQEKPQTVLTEQKKDIAVEVEAKINIEKVFEATPQKIEKTEESEIKVTFSKKLAEREEIIFNYLKENKGKTIFVKELATLLNLPNDYIYKYIKNLRNKIIEDVLINSEKGGYVLNV